MELGSIGQPADGLMFRAEPAGEAGVSSTRSSVRSSSERRRTQPRTVAPPYCGQFGGGRGRATGGQGATPSAKQRSPRLPHGCLHRASLPRPHGLVAKGAHVAAVVLRVPGRALDLHRRLRAHAGCKPLRAGVERPVAEGWNRRVPTPMAAPRQPMPRPGLERACAFTHPARGEHAVLGDEALHIGATGCESVVASHRLRAGYTRPAAAHSGQARHSKGQT